jgi:hypothetical protein
MKLKSKYIFFSLILVNLSDTFIKSLSEILQDLKSNTLIDLF